MGDQLTDYHISESKEAGGNGKISDLISYRYFIFSLDLVFVTAYGFGSYVRALYSIEDFVILA